MSCGASEACCVAWSLIDLLELTRFRGRFSTFQLCGFALQLPPLEVDG
jgi:hypothetical protein